jgi:kanamycin nucleotidyltransferase
METGPFAYTHTERLELANQIYVQLKAHYGAALLGLGLYGSLARGTDGPYSDIEMFCIIRGSGIDRAFEWSTGPWKAEINVHSPDTLVKWAGSGEANWPVTHSALRDVLPLYDPEGSFHD